MRTVGIAAIIIAVSFASTGCGGGERDPLVAAPAEGRSQTEATASTPTPEVTQRLGAEDLDTSNLLPAEDREVQGMLDLAEKGIAAVGPLVAAANSGDQAETEAAAADVLNLAAKSYDFMPRDIDKIHEEPYATWQSGWDNLADAAQGIALGNFATAKSDLVEGESELGYVVVFLKAE